MQFSERASLNTLVENNNTTRNTNTLVADQSQRKTTG
ncbi:hypothetical protein TOT_030000367 [Theileria orientalis strain Shintoku]|uniref:Uncharacterized protein n=1 Tax=Theileria orientalis strain Shintoku TaxID=869250 RepID=J4DPQ3_THEOR|nr:hypothetical protein TOT_030000367 [Theileria orientalis strain Shintoku]PVC54403.1 hypothetical protein MACL_00003111 [Theileria orientalis]BAM41104.1 hypothetical protein TOT_030000367 [Theileria orientalis strain Shintoku]|eukprot:XP_009691405.1 hypothetical protein TOT_030000367 [Theileria orientalis strain Shintoku]